MVKSGVDEIMVGGTIKNDYGFPIQLTVHHPDVGMPMLWWRSVGHTHMAYMMEVMIGGVVHATK